MEKKENNVILFLRNNGFYLVLVLCLVAIGSAIVLLTVPGDTEQLQADAAPTEAIVAPVAQSNDQSLNDIRIAPQKTQPTATPYYAPLNTAVPTAMPTEVPSPTPTPKPASTTQKAAAPVTGEIIFGFATDKLLYSVTLDQWTTHPAVDIAAKEGTEVKAVLSGTVSVVKQDDQLGYYVQIKHSNGRETIYANLGSDVRVREGEKVNAGEVIGTVGTSAISECALQPHLHFAFRVDGKAVDPAKYVRLG